MNQSATHTEDLRLEPNPRKHAKLWQIYLWWDDLVKMRVRHTNRLKSIERGKSSMYAATEKLIMEQLQLDRHVKPKNKKERYGEFLEGSSIFQMMVEEGEAAGPIWNWLLSIKGIGESLAAQVIAQIDDIERFDSVAKLWRYCGYGIYDYWLDEKGKVMCPVAGWKWIDIGGDKYRVWTVVDQQKSVTHSTDEKCAIPQNKELPILERIDYLEPKPEWKLKSLSDRLVEGYHSPYNRTLKAILWNMSDMFIKHQTPYYVDIYYSEKKRLREKYPEKVKINGKWHYNDGHISNMAMRKMRKEFIKELWLKWREYDISSV